MVDRAVETGVKASQRGQDILTRDEARARAELVSNPIYTVAFDLSGDDESFDCEAAVRFRSARPGAVTFIDLAALDVSHIELNGQVLPPSAVDGTRIMLDGLEPENVLRVSCRLGYSRSGAGLHFFRDPIDQNVYTYTDLEPRHAHRVYPCFDQPDIKGRFEFSVTARPGWRVISNAAPIERSASGSGGRWRFPLTEVLPSYVSAIVAGPYHEVRDRYRDIDLGVYCRQSLAEHLDADEILEITRQGLAFFEEVFDYAYPFGNKYDQVFVPEFGSAAMENVACVTHGEAMIFRSKVTESAREDRAQTILHEMAHMWFGDLVTMKWWDDLWLNESFATYMGQLAQVRATRFTNGWTSFARADKPWAYAQDQLPTTHPIVADVPDSGSARSNFDGISYAKGASVLKQLVAWVGERAFIDGVRTYFRQHAHRNADLAAFLAPLAEASGRDLKAWAGEWLETSGVNTLRPRFERSAESDRFATFALEQNAPSDHPTLRSHRVAIGLYSRKDGVLERVRRLEIDAVGARTPVPELAGEKIPDLILVNDDDLTYAKIRLDPGSLETITEHLGAISEPLARTLCWTAVWDQVRDGETPARHFLRLLLANIDTEDDVGVLRALLARAAAAVAQYVAPAKRNEARLTLATAARERMDEAEPGGDRQLVWARVFIAAARSAEHLAMLRSLLDGTRRVDGLEIDIDLRWGLVHALAATDPMADGLISAELARDPTDDGERRAARARAARPTPEAKAEAWATIINEPEMSLAMLKALMAGFMRHDQEELLRPYAEKYFAALDPMWRSRPMEVSVAFTSAMYPTPLMSEELVRMTGDYLTREKPAPPIRRSLLEERDHVQRALRARKVDAGEHG